MELKGKRVLVVGMGRTGVPTANRLHAMGAVVSVTDKGAVGRDEASKLSEGIDLETGSHDRALAGKFDVVVTSPGVPWDGPILQRHRERGAEVISEIELAFRLAPRAWIAITGTNGKSTTTALVGAMMRESGVGAVVCGNIGNAALGEDAIFDPRMKVVAEISSFQLEGVATFRPRVSAILNITPDHMDRHKTMGEYIRLKRRIFELQRGDDVCVLNMDDPETARLAPEVPCRLFPFSANGRLEEGVFVNDGRIVISSRGDTWTAGATRDLRLPGRANLENALAACAIAFSAGADVGAISRALSSFEALEHRLEPVAEVRGVRFINDSKGTNVGSTLKALDGMTGRVAVILGGRDKDQDFTPLADLVRRMGAGVVLIGEAAEKIAVCLKGYEPVVRADGMDDAVRKAAQTAGAGGTVLLSPACASFDMFRDYRDRGDKFRAAVRKLAGEPALTGGRG
ncbi:MAG: UDP-N-acetylmuramoyl-L-alanine--D-glutamate ligase [Nitrospinae bacterium]|nr:UDP-N-acetylmuramoyl-L-alanine--D-glutamate ligase [Nitrospinota bacterium]